MAQAYTYLGVPIIQSGIVQTANDGTATVTYPIPFPNDGRLTVFGNANIAGNTRYDITSVIAITIAATTYENFTLFGRFKDGNAGEDGGTPYIGNVNWLVVHYIPPP
jgi:hypothetical protein